MRKTAQSILWTMMALLTIACSGGSSSDSDSESDSNRDSDSHTEAGTDSNADSNTDNDTDSNSDIHTDTDFSTDSDTTTDTESQAGCVVHAGLVGEWNRVYAVDDMEHDSTLLLNGDGTCSEQYVGGSSALACTWCTEGSQFRVTWEAETPVTESADFLLQGNSFFSSVFLRESGQDADGEWKSESGEIEEYPGGSAMSEETTSIAIDADAFLYVADELWTDGSNTGGRHVELTGALSWEGNAFTVIIGDCVSDSPDYCESFTAGGKLFGCLVGNGEGITFNAFRSGPIDCTEEAYNRKQ